MFDDSDLNTARVNGLPGRFVPPVAEPASSGRGSLPERG